MKRYLLCLFLAFFFISSVSAVEINGTDSLSDYSINEPLDSIEIAENIYSNPENSQNILNHNSAEIKSAKDELIVNPDFDVVEKDGEDNWVIEGWNYSLYNNPNKPKWAGTINIENDESHGNYVVLTGGGSDDRESKLYQCLDFTNIDNITFDVYTSTLQGAFYSIGDLPRVQIFTDSSELNSWKSYTIDTKDYTGYQNFTLIACFKTPDGAYFDSFTYCLNKNINSENIEIKAYLNNPINFTYNTTDNITSWLWDFGDDTYSNISNPLHAYTEIGTYNTRLTIINNDTESKNITYQIEVIEEVTANFEYIKSGNNLLFNDLSNGNPVKWFWDWGDGTNSTYYSLPSKIQGYEFSHPYSGNDFSYSVTLTVTDKFGNTSSITKKDIIKFYNSVAYPISIDSFEDSTDGWTLSDGVSISNNFSRDGEYSVLLSANKYIEKVINFDNIDSIEFYAYSKMNSGGLRYVYLYIDGKEVYADSARANSWTHFSYSTGNLVGNHTVKLTTLDSDEMYIDNIALKTNSYYLADFTTAITDISSDDITVQFTDNSYGTYNAFLWTFDGENTSTLQNPTFTFKKGSHDVTLIIYRDGIKMSSITKNLNFDLPTIAGNSYSTIQGAIDNATNGDVIDIPNIDYKFSENLLINKSLTLNFNGAVLNAKDASVPLFNVTGGTTVTVTNIGLNKDSTLVTGSDSKLIIKDSDIGVNLVLSEGNIDLLDDSFNNSFLTLVANTNIANSTINKGGVIVNGGKSKIFNTTLTGADVAITQTAGELDIISNLITDNNIGVNVTGGKTNIEYNLIYANAKFGLVYVGDNVRNANNWWGRNIPQDSSGENLPDNYYDIFRKEADGEVDITSNLELNVNTTTSIMGINKEYPVTVYLTENSDGDTITGYLKAITLNLTSDGGSIIEPVVIKNGIGQTKLLTTNTDVENVNIILDGKNYPLNTNIISKTGVTIDVTGNLVAEGTATVTIDVPYATGNITLIVDGKSSSVKLTKSQYVLTMDNLTAGDHSIVAIFEGDEIFTSTYNSTKFNVAEKEILTSIIKITGVNGNLTVNGILKDSKDNVIGNTAINYQIDNGEIQNTITNADGSFTLTGVNGATITVSYIGNNTIGGSTDSITLSDIASNDGTNKTISELENQLNEAQVNASKLADNLTEANKTIADLNGELVDANKTIADLNGELSDSNAKVENLTAELEGAQGNATKLADDLADANKKVENLTTELADARDNATQLNNELADANKKVENLTTQLADAQSNVTVVVDGTKYPANVVNGTVTIKTNGTQPVVKKDTVIVVDQAFTRAANDYSAGERGAMFYAILKDSDGNVLPNKTVQIAVNGPIYNVTTDDEGRAGLQVNLANANTYTYALSFQGDDQYNAAPMASSKLTVTKKKTTIKAANKAFKAKTKTKKISITLKTVKNQYDGKTYLKSGKKVTLKVNGKTYTAKTNAKGVAKFTIKLTKKGKYSAKIKFAGDKTYKASSKSIKITIK